MTIKENHKERHRFLHKCLDELVADMISQTDMLPSQTSLLEFMTWSSKQTENPGGSELGIYPK